MNGKAKILIIERALRNMISESIRRVFRRYFPNKDIIYRVTMGTIPIDEVINEGVLYSYPIKQVIRHLSSTYHLAWLNGQERFNPMVHSGATKGVFLENNEEGIIVYVYNSEDNVETIKEDMCRLGWIISTNKIKLPLNLKLRGLIGLQFEKKSAEAGEIQRGYSCPEKAMEGPIDITELGSEVASAYLRSVLNSGRLYQKMSSIQ